MSDKFTWERSGHLPEPFTWMSVGRGVLPTIWAAKHHPGASDWSVKFAYGQHGLIATGSTRDEAASNLVRRFADAS